MATETPSLDTIFCAAVEIGSAEERAAYIAGACGIDHDLRGRVEKLVAAHFRAGAFLESPIAAVAATLDEPIGEGPGTVIGPYKLLEQIGEGGFGLVFMAEQQQPIRRKVALKILKPGMDTRQVIARFEAERQALALMDHPNIAKVLEGGETASGRPYFVMDLVKGVPITEYCDQNTLTTRERLELFVYVCQAVQHAHQKGIIHRDIKPSNVLVTLNDGSPLVKVIDFGIAKALGQQLTDKTLFTGFAHMIGTPLYMSPEQAALSNADVDTRSDIYSLGVLLYELLTGTTPFDKDRLGQAGYDEMRRIIREEEPPKPSTRISTLGQAATTVSAQRQSDPKRLSQLFRGELDWIIMKALEKDRNRRYETASAFAADLLRYLHDEPVQACPPSAMYRFRKFARRNKVGLAVAGLVLFFFVLLGSGVGWVARDRAARRDEGKRRAEVALQEAGRLLEEEKWFEALSLVGQAEAILRNSGGGEDRLDQAGRLRQDLQMAQSLEEARLKMTALKDRHWDSQAGDAAYAEAFEKYGLDVDGLDPQQAADRIVKSPISRQLTAALDDWAYIRRELNRVGLQLRLALARAADPDRLRNRLRDGLEGKDNQALEEVLEAGSADDWPPATLVLLGRLADRTAHAERAAALLRRTQQQHPGDFWINHQLAWLHHRSQPPGLEQAVHYYAIAVALRPQSPMAHNNLSVALFDQGKLDEAIAELQKAIAINPKFAGAHNNLSGALAKQGKLDEAIAECRKTIGLDPKEATWRNSLAKLLFRQGKLDDAIAECRKTIDLDPKKAEWHSYLGMALMVQGKHDEGLAEYHKAIDLVPNTAQAHSDLGLILVWYGKPAEGVAECKKALAIDPNCAMAHSSLGIGLVQLGQADEAVAEHKKAVAIEPKNANIHYDFAWTLSRQGNEDEALAEFKKVVAIDPNRGDVHLALGQILSKKGDYDGAAAAFREAIRFNFELAKAQNALAWLLATCPNAKLRDPGQAVQHAKQAVVLSPKDGNNWNTLGVAYYRAGNWKEELAALKRSMELGRGGNAFDWFFLAMAHWQLGNKQEARTWFGKAVAWMEKHQPQNRELRGFHAEAEAVLELNGKNGNPQDKKDSK